MRMIRFRIWIIGWWVYLTSIPIKGYRWAHERVGNVRYFGDCYVKQFRKPYWPMLDTSPVRLWGKGDGSPSSLLRTLVDEHWWETETNPPLCEDLKNFDPAEFQRLLEQGKVTPESYGSNTWVWQVWCWLVDEAVGRHRCVNIRLYESLDWPSVYRHLAYAWRDIN